MCQTIYPTEYKTYTTPLIFRKLPREISLRIHILRHDLLGHTIPFSQCIRILGYDQQVWKDQLLNKIVSSDGQNGFSVDEIKQLRSDKQVASILCSLNPTYYDWLSEEQRDDLDIALVACRGNGTSIFNASNRLRRDPHVIRAACLESEKTVAIFQTQIRQRYGKAHPLALFIKRLIAKQAYKKCD
jgi:hypothetical protein